MNSIKFSKTWIFLFILITGFFNSAIFAQETPSSLSFTTSRKAGEMVKILVEGENLQIEGLENVVPGSEEEHKLTDQTVTIKGNLTSLRCLDCNITMIDLSQARSLTILSCSGNAIKELDASACTNLQKLYCNSNEMQTLNVSTCTRLEDLYCFQNKLKTLDVSNNKELKILSCTENKIEELDVKNNVLLEELYCGDNLLKELHLENSPKIKTLWCNDNQLETIDLSKNADLKKLYCHRNSIKTLLFTNNPKLNRINCFLNHIEDSSMKKLVASLPMRSESSKGKLYIVDKSEPLEKNQCSKESVTVATDHQWSVYDYNQNSPKTYEGDATIGIEKINALADYIQISENGITILRPVDLTLYYINGEMAYRGEDQMGYIALVSGTYIASIEGQTFKIIIP